MVRRPTPPPLVDLNAEDRFAAIRGLSWGLAGSALLWGVMYLAWTQWGWWGPPGALLGGALTLAVVVLATRLVGR